jgi:hypothetical protein
MSAGKASKSNAKSIPVIEQQHGGQQAVQYPPRRRLLLAFPSLS